MTDLNDLKRKAEAAADEFGAYDPGEAEIEFMSAVTPALVLELFAENERLKEMVENFNVQFSELRIARNLLSTLSRAGFPLGNEVAESILAVRHERDQLRAEVERLTGIVGTQVVRRFVGQDDQRQMDELVALGIEQDKRELAKLRAEVEALRQIISDSATACGASIATECTIKFMSYLPAEIAEAIKQQKVELERMRKDAERYAKLRRYTPGFDTVGLRVDALDAYVDAELNTVERSE